MAYGGYYKCRLCGQKYIRIVVPNSKEVVDHFVGLVSDKKAYLQIDLLDMHSCGNDNFGLGDFQGFEKEK